MGNWRTVRIIGDVDSQDVDSLRRACAYDAEFHCLTITNGLMGLGDWVGEHINVGGNLAEREFTVHEVADTLRDLLEVAPSMDLKVHCGGDFEAKECVATITVKDGQVIVGDPEMSYVVGASQDEIEGRFLRGLMNAEGKLGRSNRKGAE